MIGPSQLRACLVASVLFAWAAAAASQTITPVDLGDGWRRSAPEDQGLDAGSLSAMARLVETDQRFGHAYALLVVRHGVLVAETYFNSRRPEQLSDVRSVTKSLTSMAYGIARSEGAVPASLDVSLRDLLPDYADVLAQDGKAAISIGDALTMQAGLRWDDAASPWLDRLFSEPDLVGFVLEEPLVATPGTLFEYSSGLTQVIGRILMARTESDLSRYVERRIFRPLGIDDWAWLQRPNGDDFAGLGARLRPRDMAKIGQMTLQRGRWQGVRVVPAAWLSDSTRDQTLDGASYGYQWWAPRDGSFWVAIGYGGQYIYCEPALDVVVVLQVDWNVPAQTQVGFSAFNDLLDELERGVRSQSPGELAAPERVQVVESAGTAVVEITRVDGGDGAVEIAYQARPGTATRGIDFDARTGIVRWSHGELGPRVIEIPVASDDEDEGVETLRVQLERSSGSAVLRRDVVTVEIRDASDDEVDDAPERVEWVSPRLVVAPGDDAVLELTRSREDLSAALEVSWSARSILDALDGSHLMASGTVGFAPGVDTASLDLGDVAGGPDHSPQLVEVILTETSRPTTLPEPALVATVDAEPTCVAASDVLCLRSGRFRVRGRWRTGDGAVGDVAWQGLSDESAWSWFFSEDRLELLVKVLDGRGVNGAHWLFYGAVSDVEYFLVAEDLAEGTKQIYYNRPSERCGCADVLAFPEVAGATSAPASAIAPARIVGRELTGSAGPGLLDRFDVAVRYADETRGLAGEGSVVPLSDETALVWFFDPANVELAVKVLDGRGVNGHFWVYAGALTDLDFAVQVTDRETGVVRTFESEEPLCALADIEAF